MSEKNSGPETNGSTTKSFFMRLIEGIIRDLVKLVVIFALGTAGGAIICLYYGFPLVYSVLGGAAIFVIVVAAFLAS